MTEEEKAVQIIVVIWSLSVLAVIVTVCAIIYKIMEVL